MLAHADLPRRSDAQRQAGEGAAGAERHHLHRQHGLGEITEAGAPGKHGDRIGASGEDQHQQSVERDVMRDAPEKGRAAGVRGNEDKAGDADRRQRDDPADDHEHGRGKALERGDEGRVAFRADLGQRGAENQGEHDDRKQRAAGGR